jgi:tRNA threonylcarbamoyladenosine biosynthesis protein TsaB
MRFLGVDTSSFRASVAITEEGRLISENSYSPEAADPLNKAHSRNNHAEVLLSLIEVTLKTAGFCLGDLSGFAVAIGPGSFTGLRIGLSTVKGLSYGCGVPVIGVSTLHACAARVSDFNGQLCTILDARKKELYGALFHRRGNLLERITKDAVMSFEQLAELLRSFASSEPILLTGDGITQYRELLVHTLGEQIFLRENRNWPTSAAAVALLGESILAEGECVSRSSLTLTPQYLRLAEAEAKARTLA